MNAMGGGGRSLFIRFVSDTAKASRDTNKYTQDLKGVTSELNAATKAAQRLKTATTKIKSTSAGSTNETLFGGGFKRGLPKSADELRTLHAIRTGSSRGIVKGLFGGDLKGGLFERKISPPIEKTISLFQRMSEGIKNNIGGLIGLTAGFYVLKASLGAILSVVRKIIDIGVLVEGARVQMETITGSKAKGQYLISEARKYARISPFGLTDTIQATSLGTQYGMDLYGKGKYKLPKNRMAMEIIGGLGSYRDMQGRTMGLSRAITAVSGRDYRLIKPYGREVSDAYEIAKTFGRLGTAKFMDKFLEQLGKIPQIMSMAKAHSETVFGLWEIIGGYIEDMAIAFTGAAERSGVLTLWKEVRDTLKEVSEYMEPIIALVNPFLRQTGVFLGVLFSSIWKLVELIGIALSPIITVLLPTLSVMLSFVSAIIKLINLLVGGISKFVQALFGLKATRDFLKDFVDISFQLIAAIEASFQAIEAIAKKLGGWLPDKGNEKVNRTTEAEMYRFTTGEYPEWYKKENAIEPSSDKKPELQSKSKSDIVDPNRVFGLGLDPGFKKGKNTKIINDNSVTTINVSERHNNNEAKLDYAGAEVE